MAVDPPREPVSQVLVEIQSGRGQSFAAAGRKFPAHRGPGTVNASTVYRWAIKGLKASSGEVIKLEAVRVGGRWLTSHDAVARFVAALTAAADTGPVVQHRSPAQRNRAAEAAARELKRRGA